jgi:hypothetical protein
VAPTSVTTVTAAPTTTQAVPVAPSSTATTIANAPIDAPAAAPELIVPPTDTTTKTKATTKKASSKKTTKTKTTKKKTTKKTTTIATAPTTTITIDLPLADSPCKKKIGTQLITADGSTATCQRVGKARFWIVREVAKPATVSPPGINGNVVKLGVIVSNANAGSKASFAAMQSHFAALNKRGGIGGRYKVELVRVDANADPRRNAELVASSAAGVVGYLSSTQANNVEAIEPLLREQQMLASVATREASWAAFPNLLPVGNSYQLQTIGAVSFYLELQKTVPDPIICAVADTSLSGAAAIQGFQYAQEKLKFRTGAIVRVPESDESLIEAVTQLRDAFCRVVVVALNASQTRALDRATTNQLAADTKWLLLRRSFESKNSSARLEQNGWVFGDGKQWSRTEPGLQLLNRELTAAGQQTWVDNPDPGLLDGFTQALVWQRLLEEANALNDLSRSGILAAASRIGQVDSMGMIAPIDYGNLSRISTGTVTVFAIDPSIPLGLRAINTQYSPPAVVSYGR